MSKKILKISGGLVGLAAGGLPGAVIGGAAGSMFGKKKKAPRGIGEPLPVGTINPDGSAIPVDKKRRRLTPATPSTILTAPPSSTTLGG